MTIIDELKKSKTPGIVRFVAVGEGIKEKALKELILSGRAVITKNIQRTIKKPAGIGKGLRTKVNANIGTSEDFPLLKTELKKLRSAVESGADTIMDLSTGGDIRSIRKEIIKKSTVPVGTVPIYETAIQAREKHGNILDMNKEDMFKTIEKQAEDGVDFMTIHAGINRKILDVLRNKSRLAGVVSRGGSFLLSWMIHKDKENPFYEDFERVVEICRKFDVTISLGDGLRPGAIEDATDLPQLLELMNLGELVKKARKNNTQVMVEGPGHIPIDQIRLNVEMQKKICDEAPFYVLGPIVTDVAPGYDHITSAIGGAMAAYYGADFLCYVTPREHLGLPDEKDVKEGVIASRIAAHAADIAKGIKGAKKWDKNISKVRKNLEWKSHIELSIDPERMKELWQERGQREDGRCSMCGEYCALKILDDDLGDKTNNKC